MKTFWIIYGIIAIAVIVLMTILSYRTLKQNWTEWWHPILSMSVNILGGVLWPGTLLAIIISEIWWRSMQKKYDDLQKNGE